MMARKAKRDLTIPPRITRIDRIVPGRRTKKHAQHKAAVFGSVLAERAEFARGVLEAERRRR